MWNESGIPYLASQLFPAANKCVWYFFKQYKQYLDAKQQSREIGEQRYDQYEQQSSVNNS